MSSRDGNPFVGPVPLGRGQKLHGREREVRELFYLLAAERIVWLHSPSGAGKTSLIRAGLTPRLEEDGFDVWPIVRVGSEPSASPMGAPGANRYLLSAVSSLEEEEAEGGGPAGGDGVAAEPGPGPEAGGGATPGDRPAGEAVSVPSLAGYLSARRERRRGSTETWPSVVLVFDQFEEVLTLDPLDVDEKREFFRQVGEALRDPGIWSLFVLREEYLAPLEPFVDFIPTRWSNTFRLDLLGREAAEQVIIRTAADGGRTFTPQAAGKLVEDLATVSVQAADGSVVAAVGRHAEPVQLQVVCRRLWDRVSGDTIDEGDVVDVGSVDEALEEFYAGEIEAAALASGVGERVIRDWVDRRLITDQGIRGQVLKGATQSEGLDNRAVRELVDAHLVRSERRRGAVWYELAHDRLVGPVRGNNAAWRARHLSLLQRQAELWEERGRPDGLLLRGEDLGEAERWAAEEDNEPTPVERDLLAESLEAREAAERERRQARRIRRLAIGATITSVVALAAFAVASWLFVTVRAQALRAESRTLALQSAQQRERRLDLALLLALEAGRTADTFEAREALLGALRQSPRLWRLLHPETGEIAGLALRPAGDTLAAGSRAGEIVLWRDVAAGRRRLARSPLGAADMFELRAVAFSPDGRWLAAGGKTADNAPMIALWDLSQEPPRPHPPPEVARDEVVVRDLAFCAGEAGATLAWITKRTVYLWPLRGEAGPRALDPPDRPATFQGIAVSAGCERLAVAGDRTATVHLWEAAGSPRALEDVPDRAGGLAFDRAGGRLAFGGRGGAIGLWHLDEGRFEPVGAESQGIVAIALSDDGRALAAGREDGGIVLHDLEQGGALELAGHSDRVTGVAFAAGGLLASAGRDGTVALWRPAATTRMARMLTGHGDEVWGVAFSPDGGKLVSGEGRPELGARRVLAAVPEDDTVRLWELDRDRGSVLPGSRGRTRAVAFSADGRHVAAGSRSDQSLHLWSLDGEPDEGLHVETASPVNAVAFDPGGRFLVSAEDATLVRRELGSAWPEARKLASHEGTVWSLLFRDRGRTLVAADDRGQVRLWDPDSGGGRGVLVPGQGEGQILAALAQSADERLLAAAGREGGAGCLHLWRMPAGEYLHCLRHEQDLSAVAFAGGDRLLVSADLGGRLTFWYRDPEAGWREIGRLEHGAAGMPLNALATSPDERLLASASDDHSIALWRLDWETLACEVAGRNLSAEEWRDHVGSSPGPPLCPSAQQTEEAGRSVSGPDGGLWKGELE